jgi:hypothetical protein
MRRLPQLRTYAISMRPHGGPVRTEIGGAHCHTTPIGRFADNVARGMAHLQSFRSPFAIRPTCSPCYTAS